jgi:hypothetical protein
MAANYADRWKTSQEMPPVTLGCRTFVLVTLVKPKSGKEIDLFSVV